MSLIIRQKRGALQLSINAIVVLILAITMLGLGLGFMRNMFSKTTGQFDDISDSMKNQVIDEIEAGNDKVIMNKYDIELKKSDGKSLYYGIKNLEESGAYFKSDFNCTGSMNSATYDDKITFKYFNTGQLIASSDVKVLKADIGAKSGVSATTYSCQVYVCKAATAAALPGVCNGNAATTNPATLYDYKDFYITIV